MPVLGPTTDASAAAAAMMSFFETKTPVGMAIERATSELQLGPNWEGNISICDMINSTPNGCVLRGKPCAAQPVHCGPCLHVPCRALRQTPLSSQLLLFH